MFVLSGGDTESMPKTKAALQRQEKPPPAPTEKRLPGRPGKAAGPQRLRMPIGGGGMTTSLPGARAPGAAGRARTMGTLQRTLGNARLGRHLIAHELAHVVQQAETSSPAELQRAHVDTNTHRKVFDSPRYQGDAKLDACLNDEGRLEPGATGKSVRRIQEGLAQDPNPPATLSLNDITGVYDAKTGQAVMAFKKKYNLGSTNFPDVGPGTTAKLDELANSGKGAEPPKPGPPPVVPPPGTCGPGTSDPFCLGLPSDNTPCEPFASAELALATWQQLRVEVPLATAGATVCSEVGPVWDAYFARTSTPFAFSAPGSCVVQAAKTDRDGSRLASAAAEDLMNDVVRNLPVTLRRIPPPIPGLDLPIPELRLPIEDAIADNRRRDLHADIIYNNPFNAAANIAGAVGTGGQGSDIFGDDDRLMQGIVVIAVRSITETGLMRGEIRWIPHVHVKDTVDFCPGNLGNPSQRFLTLPMSKLEAGGLVRDVPLTIDYDLVLTSRNFSVTPRIGPLSLPEGRQKEPPL